MDDLSSAQPNIDGLSGGTLAVTAQQAAQLLGICTKTLFAERDRGSIKGFRIGRAWRFRVAEINAYMIRQEKKLDN